MIGCVNMDIQKFYAGKTILITGATGFVGKSLIEKLLYSFPQINKIYVIIRSKNGESFEDRCKKFIENPLFIRIHEDSFSKIKWLEGDMLLPNLGLSQDSLRSIIENVEIIIHCAANVKLWTKLEYLLNANVGGTETLLEIANQCKRLISVIHVSTLFCSTTIKQSIGEEKVVYNPADYKELLLKLKNTLDDERKDVTLKIIGDAYFPYTFSKSVTENLVQKYSSILPVGIFRPGIVTHAAEEPFPGWFDSYSGLLVTLKGIELGFNMDLNSEINSNSVPVDYVTNALIAVACDNANIKNRPKVYNFSSYTNPCSYNAAQQYISNNIGHSEIDKLKRLSYAMLWCLRDTMKLDNQYKSVFQEMHLLQNFSKSVKVLVGCVATFYNHNIEELWNNLNEDDKRILRFDIKDIDWEEYIKTVVPKLLSTNLI